MIKNRTVCHPEYHARLSRFRLLDLFILTTLAAISLAAYKLLSNQPIDFWLVVYAQSVFMSIGALVTAFIVIQLSIQE